jgi:XTP/dITP diphosphohydrolase
VTRLVLLVTSPRVAPGLLSASAWLALHAGPVFAADLDAPIVAALTAAGLTVSAPSAGRPPDVVAEDLRAAAEETGTATWLMGPDGDAELARAVREIGPASSGHDAGFEIELVQGSWDLPGARLLDVVATMDRLRSPGGCPWDARQDHQTLAPYLLEEAYEAFQSIEDADLDGLREELGDVLLQVAFHARLAAELPEGERWTIDDVALGLVDKLVRRHPHVFADAVVDGVEEVNANWESIKAAERGDASVVANVPLAAPALTLAATLQRKTERAGLVDGGYEPDTSLSAAFEKFTTSPSDQSAGELLWVVVAVMRGFDIDAESALRAQARRYRDQVTGDPANSGFACLRSARMSCCVLSCRLPQGATP